MSSQLYSRKEPILLPYYPRLIYLSMLDLGCTDEELFDQLDFSPEHLHDESFRLTLEQHEQFVLRALELSQDPHLAIRLAKLQDSSKANLALLAAANSGNISKALHLIERYNSIFTRVFSIRSREINGRAAMDVNSHLEHEGVHYFAMGAFALFLDTFFCNVLAGRHLVEQVEISTPEPVDFCKVRDKYPFPITFAACRDRIYFNGDVLDKPLNQADPQTVRLLIEMCDRQLEEAEAEMSFIGAVKSVVINNIASPPKLDDAATILGVSSRGLRRKLAESGTSYKKIQDHIRMKVATKLLRETDAPIASIAYELGFGNASDFGRAFKRCCGVAPSSIRSGG